MSKLRATLVVASIAALIAMAMHGCLDITEIAVAEPDAGDDAPVRDVDPDGPRPCEQCLRTPRDPGPGCRESLDVCFGDTACQATVTCAIALGCVELGNQDAVIRCGTPCAVEAGLDPSTSSINYVIDLVSCATTTCGPICRGEVPPP
jgi:hypothetical protein